MAEDRTKRVTIKRAITVVLVVRYDTERLASLVTDQETDVELGDLVTNEVVKKVVSVT